MLLDEPDPAGHDLAVLLDDERREARVAREPAGERVLGGPPVGRVAGVGAHRLVHERAQPDERGGVGRDRPS